MSTSSFKEWKLKALTDIWTGDAERKGDRLIPTGLLGSIRWWFEVLVRGLGGEACDPSDQEIRCPDKHGRRCVVCELFGCTGWARKFRMMVLDEQEKVIQGQIKANTTFILRFIPLRPIHDEEWCLLDMTLRLIADYGAIGGRTVLKPSEEWGLADLGEGDFGEENNGVKVRHSKPGTPLREGDWIQKINGEPIRSLSHLRTLLLNRRHGDPLEIRRNHKPQPIQAWAGKRHHQDFGLISYERGPIDWQCKIQNLIEQYVTSDQWRNGFTNDAFSWASLKNFWYVKGYYLARQNKDKSTFNQVIGRPENKNLSKEGDSWLAGQRAGKKQLAESKKVFSFKHPQESRRTFGFVKRGEGEFGEIEERLKKAWSTDLLLKKGKDILQDLGIPNSEGGPQ